MKTAILGFGVALLLAASAVAHGLLGWPPFKTALIDSGIDTGVVAALGVGWYFGTASMLVFSLTVFHQAIRRAKGNAVQLGPLYLIALMYLIFGTVAYVARNFNSHFILFIATGVLVGVFAGLCGRFSAKAEPA